MNDLIIDERFGVGITPDGLIIDPDTGEVQEGLTSIILPIGSKIYTPAQQEAYKHRKNTEAKNKIRRATTNKLGNFYFARVQNYDDLTPATAVRLVYLMTYLGYDGRLKTSSRGRDIKRKDLQQILGLSESAADNFYKEVQGKYIIKDDNGALQMADKDLFRRGSIASKEQQAYYQRLYIRGVRTLYESAPVSRHKNLGYFFKLLEHINLEYNILCHNIFERDLNAIELMTLNELCDLISYEKTNVQRLIKIFNSITIDVDGKKEYFISFVVNKGTGQSKIFINPRILYAGTQFDRVAVLGAFCRADNKNSRHFVGKRKIAIKRS